MKVLREIFSAFNGQLSSKRIFGGIGFIAVLIIAVICTRNNIQAPTITEVIFISSCSLLGIDSITDIWKDKGNKDEEEIQ